MPIIGLEFGIYKIISISISCGIIGVVTVVTIIKKIGVIVICL